MKQFKDASGNLHCIDAGFEHLLPDGCIEIDQTEADSITNPPLTGEDLAKWLEASIDEHINSVAIAKGYDNRITCAMRAGYVNPWQDECVVFGQWMDECYIYCYQVQEDVLAGTRSIPTAQELIAELPIIMWP